MPSIVGFWDNERGETEFDVIDYILIFAKKDKDETFFFLRKQAKKLCKLLKQTCVAFALNNVLYSIPK